MGGSQLEQDGFHRSEISPWSYVLSARRRKLLAFLGEQRLSLHERLWREMCLYIRLVIKGF